MLYKRLHIVTVPNRFLQSVMVTTLMGMEELLYGIYGPTNNTNRRVKLFPVRLSKVFTLSKCNMDYIAKTMPI